MKSFAKNITLRSALLKSGPFVALVLSQAAHGQTVLTAAAAPTPAPPVKAFSGDINPFSGDINPFTGDLNPFAGDINPFTGDINPFAGDINPFGGDINPFVGDINPFWGTIDPAKRIVSTSAPQWLSIGSYWSDATTQWKGISDQAAKLGSGSLQSGTAATQLSASLTAFLANADSTWSNAVKARTGKTFQAGFVTPLLAKYGMKTLDASALAALGNNQRNRFFLDWYDGLMAYSGADRVDWWMSAVKWSPAITQQQGSGKDTVIGLLDADASTNYDIANNIAWSGGNTSTVNGHGAGVASLMVAAHNGRGVMGMAPRARVVAYNPFDATNSASWADVETGVAELRTRGASIINASLGVPGWTLPQEWQAIMAKVQKAEAIPAINPANGLVALSATIDSTPVYVIAAGNTGTTQTKHIAWDFTVDPAFLVVGSVGPDREISSFSNRPGNACLLEAGRCTGDRLMNHFIVAPGEFILVSDGTTNGTIRASGTSFAAPLVSGAIALLHDRWPWLAKYPNETVKIIVDTAQDLGAKGVDPVYGVGMLDVAASQSPISFAGVKFKQVKNGKATDVAAPQLLASGIQSSWDADGVYFTLYETVGDTYRDFVVPVSSRLTGLVKTLAGKQHFQRFISSKFADWVSGKNGFTDVDTFGMTSADGTKVSFTSSGPTQSASGRSLMEHSGITVQLPGNRFAVTAGHGFGALVNGAQPGFARSLDYDTAQGGANPLLGFASGGAFAQAQTRLGNGTVSMGFTENQLDLRDSDLLDQREKMQIFSLSPYSANAVNLHLTQSVGKRLTLAFDYARVREANAVLGVQSSVGSDFLGGSTTDAYSIGALFDMGGGIALAATATQGRTRTDRDQALVSEGAIASSAYSMSLQKHAFAVRGDLLALTVSQPLRVHSSTLSLTELQVTDRSTGELGSATQSFGIGGERAQISGELQYGAPFADGIGRIGLYGKGDLQAAEGRTKEFVAGGQVSVRF